MTGYESFYREFDSPLMRGLRQEAYGEDIGQHSWVSAEEVRADISRLHLSPASEFLDLGCGPCGPLTYVLSGVGCRGTGVDISSAALEAGRRRAVTLGVDALFDVRAADMNERLPFEPRSFDAVMSLDVVLHLRDRPTFFREVARVLRPGGQFLFTDAGVITGAVSNEEMQKRSAHGFTQFVVAGWNEAQLGLAGLRLVESEDRTRSVLDNAGGRLSALRAHRKELEQVMSVADVERQLAYLETTAELSRRRAVSRFMYVAEVELPR
ncbi:MAG: class I SAM-dependent methyltransferase [Gemmatimonadales bacterium]